MKNEWSFDGIVTADPKGQNGNKRTPAASMKMQIIHDDGTSTWVRVQVWGKGDTDSINFIMNRKKDDFVRVERAKPTPGAWMAPGMKQPMKYLYANNPELMHLLVEDTEQEEDNDKW